MVKAIKKYLVVLHRYFGLVLSLLFVMWFLSGFVMMYHDYPDLKKNKMLEQASPLTMSENCLLPGAAFRHSGITDTLKKVSIGTLLHRPVYRFQLKNEKNITVYADNGEVLAPINNHLAKQIMVDFSKKDIQVEQSEYISQLDQWTPRSWFKQHLPMHRFTLADEERTMIYVSSVTGEVVQMLTARERFWAWLGPIPHWIYFRDLIVQRPIWRQVVIWSSFLGVLLSITGIILGIIRYQKNKKPEANTILHFSPYKKKWFRWHHYTGFIFGLFVFTWVFSGLLSMNPLKWSPDKNLTETEKQSWAGRILNPDEFTLSPRVAIANVKERATKEIELIQFQGTPYYVIYTASHETRLVKATDSTSSPQTGFSTPELIEAVHQLHKNSPIADVTVLKNYDAYYYSKHNEKALPVVRIKMDDHDKTWYYINPQTSEVVYKYQSLSRLERWLYHGLHSLDFPFLMGKRPLWDMIMIALLLGGLALSITGLVLTIHYVKRKSKKIIHQKK